MHPFEISRTIPGFAPSALKEGIDCGILNDTIGSFESSS